jgi:large subunit ribosomal protein L18
LASKKVERIRAKRKERVRGKIFGTEAKPRLSVFRSAKHIYAQAIADDVGKTLAAASTMSSELKGRFTEMKKADLAKEVGKLIAERLKAIAVEQVVFDRGRYLYHGRVKALAEAARERGLKF